MKTVKFDNPRYIGDPVNTVRIFNEMEVDELIFLDIVAARNDQPPAFKAIEEIAGECFMPVAYGGGIRSLEDIAAVFRLGVEKVCLNSVAAEKPGFVRAAAERFGSQSIVVSIDARKRWLGKHRVHVRGGSVPTEHEPAPYAERMEKEGAGEILLTSMDLDGTMEGYDLKLIRSVSQSVSIPLVACGGAGGLMDLRDAVQSGGADAVAAGSMFVYQGKDLGVLINYPSPTEIASLFGGDNP